MCAFLGRSIDALLVNADKALYLAKSRGKRCFAIWSENGDTDDSR
jgi:PleD family two-component response regulator